MQSYCTHETKACVCAIDGRSVTLTAIGGIDRQPLRLGQALDPGDEIASTDPNAVVALTCPKSSSVNLHGRFRSVILPPASGQDCALSLLAGNADVQTSQPTELGAGTTLMGSKRTTYAMRVSSDATVACVVFEGEVQVQNLATGAVRPLTTLMSASWKSGVLQQVRCPRSPTRICRARLGCTPGPRPPGFARAMRRLPTRRLCSASSKRSTRRCCGGHRTRGHVSSWPRCKPGSASARRRCISSMLPSGSVPPDRTRLPRLRQRDG